MRLLVVIIGVVSVTISRTISNYFRQLYVLNGVVQERKLIQPQAITPQPEVFVQKHLASTTVKITVSLSDPDRLEYGWEAFLLAIDERKLYFWSAVGLILVIFVLITLEGKPSPSKPAPAPVPLLETVSKKKRARRQHTRVLQPLSSDFLNRPSLWGGSSNVLQQSSLFDEPLLKTFNAEIEDRSSSFYGSKSKPVTVQYNSWSDTAMEMYPILDYVQQDENETTVIKRLENQPNEEPEAENGPEFEFIAFKDAELRFLEVKDDEVEECSYESQQPKSLDGSFGIGSPNTPLESELVFEASDNDLQFRDSDHSVNSTKSFISLKLEDTANRASVIDVTSPESRRKQLLHNELESIYTLDYQIQTLLNNSTSKDASEFFQMLGIDVTLSLSACELQKIFDSLYQMSFFSKKNGILDTIRLEVDLLLINSKYETKEFIISKLRYVLCTEYRGSDSNMVQLIDSYKTFLQSSTPLLFQILENDSFTFTETFSLICDCFSFTKVVMELEDFIMFTMKVMDKVNDNPSLSECISEYLSFCFATLDMESAPKVFKEVCKILTDYKVESDRKYYIILKCLRCYLCFNKDELTQQLTSHPSQNKFDTCAFNLTRTYVEYLPKMIQEVKNHSTPPLLLEVFNMYQIIAKLFVTNDAIPSPIRYELLSSLVTPAYSVLKSVVHEEYEDFNPPIMIESLPFSPK